MKNNQFKKLAVLGAVALPLASAAFGSVDVGLSLSGGYRWDNIRRSGDAAGITGVTHVSERDKVNSLTVDLDAVVALNSDFYVRVNGNYGGVISNPKETVAITGTSSSNTTGTIDDKNHCYGFGGAVGYQFDFSNGEFSLAPEFGYTFSRMKIVDADFLGVGAPFIGLQFRWMFAQNWSMDLGASYYFIGSRHEKYAPAAAAGLGSGYMKKGNFMGPEGNLAFFYYLGESWSLGLKYRFKYIESAKRAYPDGATSGARLTNERTRWITNHVSIEAGYTF
jgi:hypothetical protein